MKRRLFGLCAALGGLGIVIAAPGGDAVSPGPGSAVPQPVLGAADLEMTLLGSAREGAAGETWGYRRLPLSVGQPAVSGNKLQFGPVAGSSPDPQLAFTRYTASTGWQIYETPLDQNGAAYRGFLPNRLSGRITPHAGGVLIGRDATKPADSQVTVMRRNPGGRFAVLADPPADVLLPGEVLAGDRGTGRVADAAIEESNGKTGAFIVPIGRDAEDAVVHFNGTDWEREPIEVPAGSENHFAVTAIAAASSDNVWALARTDSGLGRGIVLLERVPSPTPHWVERDLHASRFSSASTPADGVDAVHALEGASDPLTVTADGVWIDGSLHTSSDDDDHDFTLYFSRSANKVTSSWCDARFNGAALCDRPLGASFAAQDGYRSFAWSGGGFGTRVITDALTPDRNPDGNAGTYLSLQDSAFVRMAGAGGNRRRGGAFSSATEGWLDGPVHVTTSPESRALRESWPLSVRSPITSVARQPGTQGGEAGAQALAAGLDGAVLRFAPGKGWQREFLLTSTGAVAKAALRGVAWPEQSRAYAVGDIGAMWLWRSDTGLWEKDPAAPVGFDGNLMDVAFSPDGSRGFAVGKGGVLLSYGKTWSQDAVPAGFAATDFTQIAFAGQQALVAAGGDLLVDNGGGWSVDRSAHDLLHSVPGEQHLFAVAGLPDGGAVAAGENVVIERDSAGSAWRFADQPLPGSTTIAAAAVRDGGSVRAIVSVVPRVQYPQPDLVPPVDPNVPTPLLPPFPLPGDGYVLRETASGWHDEQHTAFSGSGSDRPVKSDPILDFDLGPSGQGWAVGGWSGEADSAGRGSSGRNPTGKSDRQRVQTAGIYRYGDGDQTPPPAATGSPVPLPAGPARFLVGGHAQCEQGCADLAAQDIAPDRTLSAAIAEASQLRQRENGPRFFAYTGGRLPPSGVTRPSAETDRYAQLLAADPGLPVFPAPSSGDAIDGAASFSASFAGFGAPFGSSPAASGIDAAAPGAVAGPGARTHYAFDSQAAGGKLRVIVIDNSSGSLAASDGHQNPPEPQKPWLASALASAKAAGIPSVVIGSRDLNTRIKPSLNTASDGDEIGRLLVDGGASAYFFERPEENRSYRIPSGGGETIPSFGTGTLGYRSPISDPGSTTRPDAAFGDAGIMLAEVDVAKRDPASNRSPVGVRLVPIVDDLSLLAVDGTLLRRSRPALFQGLGRRPIAGDRWGKISSSDGNANPPGGDPYVSLPPSQCVTAGCSTRVDPEFEFTSSDPDIGDFVKQDPNSTNLRKPFTNAADKVVTDNNSGLFCPFNAGQTTVTARAGGLAYSQVVTVQPGTVQRPCGTRPLNPSRFKSSKSGSPSAPPPPPPAAGGGSPPVSLALPAVPVVAKVLSKPRPPFDASVPKIDSVASVPIAPLVPPPPALRPSPPGGGMGRAYQVEKKEEEEHATEDSHAFSRYHPDDGPMPTPYLLAAIVLAAIAGATLRRSAPGRGRRDPAIAYSAQFQQPSTRQYRRSRR